MRHLYGPALITALMILQPCRVLAAPPGGTAKSTCRLERYASLPITTLPDGRFTVPVKIGDRPLDFLVDTGGAVATLSQLQTYNLKLATMPTGNTLQGVAGSKLDRFAMLPSFSLGPLKGGGIPIYVDHELPNSVDGTLSPDMMSHYDVDIDIASGTLNIFSQEHCRGQVVYWTKTGYIAMSMDLDKSGHIGLTLKVDGKEVDALLDTGARRSIISMRAARALGITEKSPDLKLLTAEDSEHKLYSYPFKTLDFDGITVSKPYLLVASDNYLPGRTEMLIGVGILRQLHLYVAYGEEKLYITPALAK